MLSYAQKILGQRQGYHRGDRTQREHSCLPSMLFLSVVGLYSIYLLSNVTVQRTTHLVRRTLEPIVRLHFLVRFHFLVTLTVSHALLNAI